VTDFGELTGEVTHLGRNSGGFASLKNAPHVTIIVRSW
jgi:hypothetical protein